ncbi:hypothetical protein [Roseospirillum parvum]|uniref:Uncharacterized protein n=1 Tax=Roseospirillum parvum TaxID=83401 RepID=A0A1G7TZY7_9PROT|nr:hypothetical protein [Roseospirillum parvum]SDG40843.1 hypothetical protein SAMN05421742_101160 [Roseospirillum parvum]
MPTEIRRIIFTDSEIQSVLDDFTDRDRGPIPRGRVIGYEVVKDKPLEVSARIQSEDGRQGSYRLNEAFLVAALLSFLIARKVPVPRQANKSVKRSDKGVVFDLVTESWKL